MFSAVLPSVGLYETIRDKRCDNQDAHDGTLDDVNMDSLPHEKATVLIDQEPCRAIPAAEASLTLPFIPRWA